MMDLGMMLVFVICYASLAYLIEFCNKQALYGGFIMLALLILVVLLGGYLVYALVNPEKF